MKKEHPAKRYNEIRRIIFNTFDKDKIKARDWLENYKNSLGPRGYAGLKAEVEFYDAYDAEYDLDVTLDYGESSDFSAIIGGLKYRIDVTTNIKYKRLENYEPYQAKGKKYKIAVYEDGKFELVDVNFPFCMECEKGRLFNAALLHGRNHKNNQFTDTNNQSLIKVCGNCGKYDIISDIESYCFPDFDEIGGNLCENLGIDDPNLDNDPSLAITLRKRYNQNMIEYATQAIRYLKKEFSCFIVAIGSPGYKITGRRGEGKYTVQARYIEDLVLGHFSEEFNFNFDDLPDRAEGG